MTKDKHTPGPWFALSKGQDDDYVPGFEWMIYAEGYGAVGYWTGHKSNHKDERWYLTESDARLIAAAPDMLEALEFYADRFAIDPAGDKARAAIAKAKGENT